MTCTSIDSTMSTIYTVYVYRRPSSVATLESITVTSPHGYFLTPVFDSTTTIYSVNVSNAVASVNISATPTSILAQSVLTGAGAALPASVSPQEGGSAVVDIVAVAQDGVTTETYYVTVHRAPSDDASASLVTVAHVGATIQNQPGHSSVQFSVPNNVTHVNISATATHALAQGCSSLSLVSLSEEGSSTFFMLTCSAQSGYEKGYNVSVFRLPSTDAYLHSLDVVPFNSTLNTTWNVSRDFSSNFRTTYCA